MVAAATVQRWQGIRCIVTRLWLMCAMRARTTSRNHPPHTSAHWHHTPAHTAQHTWDTHWSAPLTQKVPPAPSVGATIDNPALPTIPVDHCPHHAQDAQPRVTPPALRRQPRASAPSSATALAEDRGSASQHQPREWPRSTSPHATAHADARPGAAQQPHTMHTARAHTNQLTKARAGTMCVGPARIRGRTNPTMAMVSSFVVSSREPLTIPPPTTTTTAPRDCTTRAPLGRTAHTACSRPIHSSATRCPAARADGKGAAR